MIISSYNEDETYTTISEHTTTDTSLNESIVDVSDDESNSICNSNNTFELNDANDSDFNDDTNASNDVSENDIESNDMSGTESYDNTMSDVNDSINADSDLNYRNDDSGDTDAIYESDEVAANESESEEYDVYNDMSLDQSEFTGQESADPGYLSLNFQYNTVSSDQSDSEMNEWDVTTSSMDIPSEARSPNIFSLTSLLSPRFKKAKANHISRIREQAFRERSWSLEECSICFEVMLRNHEIMTLPCSHNFHSECIMPWLQEKQTCPNCRKSAD